MKKIKIMLTFLHFFFILNYIWGRSRGPDNSHCDIQGFQCLTLALGCLPCLRNPICQLQAPCWHLPLDFWLLLPYVRFHCLESSYRCPWWEHQGLRQGTPDAPGRCYSSGCESRWTEQPPSFGHPLPPGPDSGTVFARSQTALSASGSPSLPRISPSLSRQAVLALSTLYPPAMDTHA